MKKWCICGRTRISGFHAGSGIFAYWRGEVIELISLSFIVRTIFMYCFLYSWRIPFENILVIGNHLNALNTDIFETPMVRKVEVRPIRSGAIKIADSGFFIVEKSANGSFGLPSIMATTTGTRKNIDNWRRIASNMLLDFKFSSRNSSTGNSRTMDSIGLADKAAFITTRKESGRGMQIRVRVSDLWILELLRFLYQFQKYYHFVYLKINHYEMFADLFSCCS